MKTLYFEGAGLSSPNINKAIIGNCYIRTAFHLDDGRAVYLAIYGGMRTKYSNPKIQKWKYTGFVDRCYYITDDVPNDDCNKHPVALPSKKAQTFRYTEEAVLKFVNSLGASFDAIKVLPNLGGYHVFPGKPSSWGPEGYYYGDEFQYDPEMVARREAVYDKVYDIEKDDLLCDRAMNGHKFSHSPGSVDYPNFSLWVDGFDPGLLHLLRRFIGYNKHWSIRTDVGTKLEDWMATAKETHLGKYGC